MIGVTLPADGKVLIAESKVRSERLSLGVATSTRLIGVSSDREKSLIGRMLAREIKLNWTRARRRLFI